MSSSIASGTVHSYVCAAAEVDPMIVNGYVAPPSVEYSSLAFGMEPVSSHVISSVAPTFQISPPFGAVSVKSPRILNVPAETSFASELEASLTRTLHVVDRVSGISHAYVSLLDTEATISFRNVVPSVEYSIFTFATVPYVVHVIFLESPTVQTSPPSGAVMSKPAFTSKTASETLYTSTSAASEIFTLSVLPMASGIVHGKVSPPAGVEATMAGYGHVDPLSVE